jgi:hypothetical protein
MAYTYHPYEYFALLDQQGSNPPTAIVMKNTFPGTVDFQFTYSGNGIYFFEDINETGPFITDRTIVELQYGTGSFTQVGMEFEAQTQTVNSIIIQSNDPGNNGDGAFTPNPRWFKVTVYPQVA